MAATEIGDNTSTIIVHDNATPANGTWAWYITGSANFFMPRKALVNMDLAASSNIKEKNFDLTGVCRLQFIIKSLADYQNWMKALDDWDSGDDWLYLTVKNEWATNLATRGTKALPTTQNQWRGKLFNLRYDVKAAEVTGNIEFHYTTQ